MATIESTGTSISIGGTTYCLVSVGSLGEQCEVIDSTCLSNSTFRTAVPATLNSSPELTFTCDYVPATGVAPCGVESEIVITFPGTIGTMTFYGVLTSFTVNESASGERWTATGSITPTHSNAGVETGPVFAAATAP